jgi:NAD dependent epimerase/dehydratase
MNWAGKRVLVTGAGGFIGSHLCEALVARGAKVCAFLRYKSDGDLGLLRDVSTDVFRELTITRGDLKDPSAVRSAIKDQDVVFHLAALIGIPFSYERPLDYVQTNVLGSAHVLDACRQMSVEKLVQTSTSEVYGTALKVPIDEEHPLQGQSPYAATKIAADQLALSYFLSFGLPVTIVRPFNTYGPRQSMRAIIPTVISQALQSDVIRVGSLWPIRDLNFVSDTVNGFIAAAETPASSGQVLNFGSGKEVSIGDLITMILKILGKDMKVETDEQRVRPAASEVGRLIADSSKARRLLNWQPQNTLEQGLSQTIEWLESNLDTYQDMSYHV